MCWKRERRGGDVKSIFCWLMSKTLRYWWWSAFTAVWRRMKNLLRWLSAFGHQTLLNFGHSSDKSRSRDESRKNPGRKSLTTGRMTDGGEAEVTQFYDPADRDSRAKTHKSLNGPEIQFTLNSKGKYVAVIWLSSNNSSCASDIFPSGTAVCGSFGNFW